MRCSLGPMPVRQTIAICSLGLAAATVGLTAQASGTMNGPAAKEARRVYLVENASLKFVTEQGPALAERGHATGTYNTAVTAILTIHPTSVTAVVTIFPKGGSITGTAQANYIVKGSTGYFGGTLTITRGTGTYRHASGKALGFSGTVNRYSFAMTVKAHGEVSL
jgi:hypothetical protein